MQAPHRRPPRQFHDATDYPERHPVAIDVVEFVQSPTRVDPALLRHEEEPATVAFALALRTFHSPHDSAPHDAYDRGYCERLHGILTAPFVVVQAYEVHIDRGNSAPSPWDETFGSLGTDPGKATKGFATLAEAKAFAATLMAGAAEAADAGP